MDRATIQTHLDGWIAAQEAIQTGQSYSIGDQTVTAADAAVVMDWISYWQRELVEWDARAAGSRAPAGASVATFIR